MSILVFAEHDGKDVKSPSLHAISAAKSLGKVTVLLLGSGAKNAAETAKNIPHIGEIWWLTPRNMTIYWPSRSRRYW